MEFGIAKTAGIWVSGHWRKGSCRMEAQNVCLKVLLISKLCMPKVRSWKIQIRSCWEAKSSTGISGVTEWVYIKIILAQSEWKDLGEYRREPRKATHRRKNYVPELNGWGEVTECKFTVSWMWVVHLTLCSGQLTNLTLVLALQTGTLTSLLLLCFEK